MPWVMHMLMSATLSVVSTGGVSGRPWSDSPSTTEAARQAGWTVVAVSYGAEASVAPAGSTSDLGWMRLKGVARREFDIVAARDLYHRQALELAECGQRLRRTVRWYRAGR